MGRHPLFPGTLARDAAGELLDERAIAENPADSQL